MSTPAPTEIAAPARGAAAHLALDGAHPALDGAHPALGGAHPASDVGRDEQVVPVSTAALRAAIRGEVFTPADGEAYDRARAACNLLVDQHPLVIAVPESADEVATVVRFARVGGHRVAVQATGHGVGRPADGAVLILTTRLAQVTIDPEARTACVQAGARWVQVLGPAQEHGLAPLLGSTSDVGAVGYVLGGGLGWLARRYGLGADSVRWFDVVTPDGALVRCSRTREPELFWALQGAGVGAFGIVTEMEIDLYPVETVYAGNLLYPIDMAREVFARWRTWVAGVGSELTSSVLAMNFPASDDVPEPVRGRSFVIVRGCWCGDLDAGAAHIDEWRAWRRPELDLFGPMPFALADAISGDPVEPLVARVTNEWFDALPDDAIDVILDVAIATSAGPNPLVIAEVRHVGGAVRVRGAGNVAERGRTGEFLLELTSLVADPSLDGAVRARLARAREALAPFVTGATYLNFLHGEDRRTRSIDAFSPEHLDRLRALKRRLDPDDRLAHGIGLGG